MDIDSINENAAAIHAVAVLLGAAEGVSDEVRAEACALIARLAAEMQIEGRPMVACMVGAEVGTPEMRL